MLMYVSSNLEKLVLDSSSVMNMTKCKAFCFIFILTIVLSFKCQKHNCTSFCLWCIVFTMIRETTACPCKAQ